MNDEFYNAGDDKDHEVLARHIDDFLKNGRESNPELWSRTRALFNEWNEVANELLLNNEKEMDIVGVEYEDHAYSPADTAMYKFLYWFTWGN